MRTPQAAQVLGLAAGCQPGLRNGGLTVTLKSRDSCLQLFIHRHNRSKARHVEAVVASRDSCLQLFIHRPARSAARHEAVVALHGLLFNQKGERMKSALGGLASDLRGVP